MREFIEPPEVLWRGNSRSSHYFFFSRFLQNYAQCPFVYHIFFKGENLREDSGNGEKEERKFTFH